MNVLETRTWQLDTSPRFHNDVKEVVYFYTYPLFINLVETGGLK